MLCGLISSILFGTLFLSGVLALPTVLGFGAPILFVEVFYAFVFCFSRYKNAKIFRSIRTGYCKPRPYHVFGMFGVPEKQKTNKMIYSKGAIIDK